MFGLTLISDRLLQAKIMTGFQRGYSEGISQNTLPMYPGGTTGSSEDIALLQKVLAANGLHLTVHAEGLHVNRDSVAAVTDKDYSAINEQLAKIRGL